MTINTDYSGINTPNKSQKKEESTLLNWGTAAAFGAGAGLVADEYIKNSNKYYPKKYLSQINSIEKSSPLISENFKQNLEACKSKLRNIINTHKPKFLDSGYNAAFKSSNVFVFSNISKQKCESDADRKAKQSLDKLIEMSKKNITLLNSFKWTAIGAGLASIVYLGYKIFKPQDKH